MPVEPTGRNEEPSKYYDRIYYNARNRGGYNTGRYRFVYDTVLAWLQDFPHVPKDRTRIIECGCGTGALAKCLMDAGYWYRGFDFSGEALRSCGPKVRPYVWRATAYSGRAWSRFSFNTVVAVETFEHLDDHRVLLWIPKNTRVLFTVPDFDSRSHLRRYPDADSIQEYYRGKLAINCTKRIQTQPDKAITVCDGVRLG